MIYEIPQMITLLEKFFDNIEYRVGIVGGIAGTEIEEYVMNAALRKTPFSKILILNGCQDFIAALKNPIPNVMFWADIMYPIVIESAKPYDTFKPKIMNPKPEWSCKVNMKIVSQYDICVMFNAHLIPWTVRDDIIKYFPGKIMAIIDPVETEGSSMYEFKEFVDTNQVPVLVDTLAKVSPVTAMARSTIGYETRFINKKSSCTVIDVSSISKRSIGKLDDKQYITTDFDLYEEITERQSGPDVFKKGHKLFVRSKYGHVKPINGEGGNRIASIVSGTMVVVLDNEKGPIGGQNVRLYNSKTTFNAKFKYSIPDGPYDNAISQLLEDPSFIYVSPANILTPSDVKRHRFNNAVLITNDGKHPILRKERYTILKNCNNLTVINKK